MHRIMLAILTVFILHGCSTAVVRDSGTPYENTIFPATQKNFKVLAEKDNFILGGFKYILILDIPFSLVTDILLLPYDVIMNLLSDDGDPENSDTKKIEI